GSAHTQFLDEAEWGSMLQSIGARFATIEGEPGRFPGTKLGTRTTEIDEPGRAPSIRLPLNRLSRVWEENDAFYVQAVLEHSKDFVRTAVVAWRKTPFDEWWELNRARFPAEVVHPQSSYSLVAPSGECPDDTWSPMAQEIPDPRYGHTAVWTGSEMIVC